MVTSITTIDPCIHISSYSRMAIAQTEELQHVPMTACKTKQTYQMVTERFLFSFYLQSVLGKHKNYKLNGDIYIGCLQRFVPIQVLKHEFGKDMTVLVSLKPQRSATADL